MIYEKEYRKRAGTAPRLTPLSAVGTTMDGNPNNVCVRRMGITGRDRMMVGLAKPHYTNKGIRTACFPRDENTKASRRKFKGRAAQNFLR